MAMFYRFRLPSGRVTWGKLVPGSVQRGMEGSVAILDAIGSENFLGAGVPASQKAILSASYQAAVWSGHADGFLVDETAQAFVPGVDAKVLAPIEMEKCTGIWAAGLNYRKHAAEVGMPEPRFPVLFTKGLNSVIGAFDPVVKPAVVSLDEMDYEAELAIVIGKPCKDVSPEEAMEYVLGITAANDISSRKWQGKKGGGQWCRSKSYDTFLPLGPALVLPNGLRGRGQELRIGSSLARDGGRPEAMQNSTTKDMIFSVAELVSFISQDTTLMPWMVLLTGTPEGVGLGRKPESIFLRPGDVSHVFLEGVGTLSNPVIDKTKPSKL